MAVNMKSIFFQSKYLVFGKSIVVWAANIITCVPYSMYHNIKNIPHSSC